MEKTAFKISIDHFDVDYTWGIGDKGTFLHKTELHFRGRALNPTQNNEELPALLDIETLNDIEPKSHVSDHDFVAIGKIEIKTVVQAYAVVPRSGISHMLQLLGSGKKCEFILTRGSLEEDRLGGKRADLLRLSLFTTL